LINNWICDGVCKHFCVFPVNGDVGDKNHQWHFEWAGISSFLNGLNFNKADNLKEFLSPFNNIGIGIAILFDKLVLSEGYPYEGIKNPKAPTIKQWMKAIKSYGPTSGNDDYDVDVINIFLKGKAESGTFLFDPDEYFPYRFSR
jgi:hypothetical protein